MTDSEREFITQQLQRGRNALTAAIAGASEAQASFRPESGRWSIADCVEHVAITEGALYQLVTGGVANPDGISLDPTKYHRLADAMLDRSRKVVAPERARPTGRFASIEEAARQFLTARDRSMAFARDCDDDLRRLFCLHPLFGEMDCYRCLIMLALHPARHAAQIEEIKQAAAGYASV